jgi:lycopene elongase/hydratase (dihydrobisanhydrobacterioruberin-forming)
MSSIHEEPASSPNADPSLPGGDAGYAPRSLSRTRRIGYRLLPGDGYSYLLHTRPREWPIVAAHALFGYLIALPMDPEVGGRWPIALLGVAVFVVFLNGGTLAINSAFDRDEGDIGYLDAPPPPPPHLFAFGMALMLAGLGISLLWLPLAFTLVYGACLVMSVVYSVPPFRWKAVAGLDLLINALGFGVLTALAGWTLSGVAVPGWALSVLIAFGPLFAALYPLTQLYQFEEDYRRGDRTLALAMGMRNSLVFAIAMTVVAFLLLGFGVAAGPGGPLWMLVALPAAAWLALLLRWLARHPTMSPAEHKRGMYFALQAWALTNATVLVAVLAPSFP